MWRRHHLEYQVHLSQCGMRVATTSDRASPRPRHEVVSVLAPPATAHPVITFAGSRTGARRPPAAIPGCCCARRLRSVVPAALPGVLLACPHMSVIHVDGHEALPSSRPFVFLPMQHLSTYSPAQGSKQEAAAAELQWLSAYNYAWNARCNQRSRHVQLQPAWCGLQVAAVQVPPPWQPAAAAAQRRPRRNSKAQQQPMQPQLLHYQHQPQPPPPQPLQYQQQAAASTLMQMQAGACGPLGSAQQQHGWSASTPVDRCSSAAMEWQAGGQPALAMPWPPQQAADRRGQGAPAMQQQQQQQVYHVRQQQQQQQQQVVPQQQGDRVWQPPLQASHDALMPYGVVWHK